MNKVLLVDDEVLVRNDIHSLIDWEAHGFIICGEAVNGLEAIQMIEHCSPHIVIVDINMPGMDGVSLCKYMQEHYVGIKKIVLSSYDKFDYVRDTMKNGAIDYLLKHELDGAALLKILKKARNELTEEAEQLKIWETISPSVTQSAIRDLVLGRKEALDQIKSLLNDHIFLKSRHIVVAALQIENFIILTGQYDDVEKNKFITTAMDLCKRIVNDLKLGIVSYIDQGRLVIVFFFEEYSQNYIHQQIADTLHKIRSSLEKYLNINIFFEYSDVIHGLNNIPQCYETTCMLLKKRSFTAGSTGVVDHSIGEQLVTLSLDHERKLMNAVKLLDERSSHAIIEDVFSPFQVRKANDDSIQLIVNELIHIANKVWLKSRGNHDKYYKGNYLSRDQIRQSENLDETLHWLKNLYSQLIQRLTAASEDEPYSNHVRLAVKYINIRYSENISLDQAAEHIGISSSYLSRLFKEEMNCGFTEYLNHRRIKAAKQFIETGEYQIKDIYEKTGFSSYNYFFKVFKDTTGVTPHTYSRTSK